MRSTAAAGAHTPREKTFRPLRSCTAQWSPAAFTRRVNAASPGGTSTQPSGTVRTRPSAARTVFGVGPGVKVWSLIRRRLLAELRSCHYIPFASASRPLVHQYQAAPGSRRLLPVAGSADLLPRPFAAPATGSGQVIV